MDAKLWPWGEQKAANTSKGKSSISSGQLQVRFGESTSSPKTASKHSFIEVKLRKN
jgi:hypothetical protein